MENGISQVTLYLRGLIGVVAGVWLSVTLAFFALRVAPYDAIGSQLIESGASPVTITERRAALGLDDPILTQYGRYLVGLIQGDLGVSLLTGQPVQELLALNVVPTLQLGFASLSVGVVLGVPLGLWGEMPLLDGAARRIPGAGFAAKLRNLIATLSLSVPTYWSGTLIIWLFAVQLDWFPASGAGGLEHLVLPAMVLGFSMVGGIAAMTATLFDEVRQQEFIRTAYAKGLPERMVIYGHGLRAILPGVVSYVGTQVVFVLGGTVMTEAIFTRPGLGRLMVDAATRQDYPIVQGVVIWVSLLVATVNVASLFMRHRLDPRPGH